MGSVVSAASAALAFATAAIGAVSLIAPSTPTQAAAPACSGTPVYGAKFLAQTVEVLGGANARTGPSTAYPQVNRFSVGCSLGFDGYCIGEPIGDFRAPLGREGWPDQRWLILHRRDELVASGRVQSQSKESRLGGEPDKRCARWGGLPLPKVGKLTVTPPGKGQSLATLQVESTGAVVVGYAVHLVTAPVDGVYPYDRIGAKTNAPGFSAQWNPSFAAQHLRSRASQPPILKVPL